MTFVTILFYYLITVEEYHKTKRLKHVGHFSKSVNNLDMFFICFKIFRRFKGQFTQKLKFCHNLLALIPLQTHMNVFRLLKTKEDISKNVDN